MLDVALLTANASQLKYVLQVGADNHPFYYLMLSLIIISIILQVSSFYGLLNKPQTKKTHCKPHTQECNDYLCSIGCAASVAKEQPCV